MVIVSPLSRVGLVINGLNGLINGGDPNHLQVLGAHPPTINLDFGPSHPKNQRMDQLYGGVNDEAKMTFAGVFLGPQNDATNLRKSDS